MTKGKIYFFIENISFTLQHKRKIRKWIIETISNENKIAGEINFILCDDKYLSSLNKTYLHKDTLTDVIAFDYCEKDIISGDIYISYERIKENAQIFNLSTENELLRLIIHGALHLVGYKDKVEKEKLKMSEKEDYYLNKFKKLLKN